MTITLSLNPIQTHHAEHFTSVPPQAFEMNHWSFDQVCRLAEVAKETAEPAPARHRDA